MRDQVSASIFLSPITISSRQCLSKNSSFAGLSVVGNILLILSYLDISKYSIKK